MNAPTRMSHLLTPEEIEHYHEHGYVTPRWRLPADRLERMRADLEALLDANQGVSPDSMFCPHITTGGTQGLQGSNTWQEHARIPEVLDQVTQVIGPNFLLWGTTVALPTYAVLALANGVILALALPTWFRQVRDAETEHP